MENLKELLNHVFLGLPVWAWAIIAALGAVNELVLKSTRTEARSLWQGLWRFILWLPAFGGIVARLPLLGQLAVKFAGMDPPPSLPADLGPFRTPAPSCAACGQALPERRAPAEPPPLPPPPGESGHSEPGLLIVLVFAGLSILAAYALAGCADAFSYARATVSGADRINGAAARLALAKVKECTDSAVDLAKQQRFDEAEARVKECEKQRDTMDTALRASTNATGAAAAAIDVAERVGQKDLTGSIAPLTNAIRHLVRLFKDFGVELPWVPGVLQ